MPDPGDRRPTLRLELEVASPLWAGASLDLDALAHRVADAVAQAEAIAGEACVLFADDPELRALNLRHRGEDKATNVLAFPAPETPAPGPRFWGDVAIAYETTVREATEQGKRPEAHVAHLLAHGLLHLLGHDHVNDDEAERMEARERAILGDLGYDDPYALREGAI